MRFPAFEDSDYGYNLIGGRLVYEKRGQTYAAPIPDLSDSTVTTTNMFGTYTSNQISGLVSYPLGADNSRGYILYVMYLDENRVFGATGINYYHAPQPFNLPYRTPRETHVRLERSCAVAALHQFQYAVGALGSGSLTDCDDFVFLLVSLFERCYTDKSLFRLRNKES